MRQPYIDAAFAACFAIRYTLDYMMAFDLRHITLPDMSPLPRLLPLLTLCFYAVARTGDMRASAPYGAMPRPDAVARLCRHVFMIVLMPLRRF